MKFAEYDFMEVKSDIKEKAKRVSILQKMAKGLFLSMRNVI